jgi:hypothetical protein
VLRGEYRSHGKNLVDPPPGEAADTLLGLQLEGPAAREQYRRVKARRGRDPSAGDDCSRSKTPGASRCTEPDAGRGWRCEFGTRLDAPRRVPGATC